MQSPGLAQPSRHERLPWYQPAQASGRVHRQKKGHSARYLEELVDVPGIEPLAFPEWDHRHAWHLFIVRVDEAEAGIDRERFMANLKERGIGTGIHFKATHTHRWYRENGFRAVWTRAFDVEFRTDLFDPLLSEHE